MVTTIIGILAALLLSVLGHAKIPAKSISCVANLKQLQMAYRLYGDENRDALPPNISRRVGFDQVNVAMDGRVPWVLGNAKIDTNTANIEAGSLYHYIGSPVVYRCPADTSTVRNHPDLLRTRSYSISLWLNVDIITPGNASQATPDPANLHTFSQFIDPGASKTWVLIDEHSLSIDDGVFLIIRGTSDFCTWSSYRGDPHNNGANLSFGDGHVEHYPWRCRRNFPPYRTLGVDGVGPDDCADLARLMGGLPYPPHSSQTGLSQRESAL